FFSQAKTEWRFASDQLSHFVGPVLQFPVIVDRVDETEPIGFLCRNRLCGEYHLTQNGLRKMTAHMGGSATSLDIYLGEAKCCIGARKPDVAHGGKHASGAQCGAVDRRDHGYSGMPDRCRGTPDD